MYFNYHNRLKQLLNSENYICVKENNNLFSYRFIFPALLKDYPIREYRVEEYKEYIKKGIEKLVINKEVK